MPNLLWLQAGACSGDSMSLLCAESPNFVEALETYNVRLLWHPSLALESIEELDEMIGEIEKDKLPLDVLCIEGSIMTGPDGSGMYDTFRGRPKKDVIEKLCQKASIVIAVGTCSSFGGVPAAPPNPTDSIGLQWFKGEAGGLLKPDWKSKAGLPVINLSGCPVHPNTIVQTLVAALLGTTIPLDHLNRPQAFYETIVHQGCTRNDAHEFNAESTKFGKAGCLFFNLGCQGPLTSATCNTILWNGVSSKPRAGVPCFGCTSPAFPRDKDLLKTDKIGEIPLELPLGVHRAYYMAYKGLASAAKPKRID